MREEHLLSTQSRAKLQGIGSSLSHFCTALLFFLASLHAVTSLSNDGVALLEIKSAINSDPLGLLSDWKEDGEDPCLWSGIRCDPLGSRVVSINFTGNSFYGLAGASFNHSDGFCGSFSSELHFLSLRGLPCQISSLSAPASHQNGIVLGYSSGYDCPESIPCKLEGSLSPAIGNLTHLQTLSLPFLGFSGEIPKEIGALKFLEVLNLAGNAFSGGIPVEFSQLGSLRVLNLAYNSLNGVIPSELSRCRRIRVFDLTGNMLTGRIPLFFGGLPDLGLFALSFNQLIGPIPRDFSNGCKNLKHLLLSGNFLTGTIPAELGNCSSLQSLLLFSNFLSGPIPSELGQLSRLQSLDVSRNVLGGVIPSELGNCSNLSVLVLTNLMIIEPLKSHSNIEHLTEYANKDKSEQNIFLGALPDAIVGLPHMKILWAPSAGLNGSLPLDWGRCERLEVLNLGGNMLTGEIPSGIESCKNLIYLDLSSNGLEGNMPDNLAVPCMVVFNVSRNTLSGPVYFSGSADKCPDGDLLSPQLDPSALPLWMEDGSIFSLNVVSSYFWTLYCGSILWSLPVSLPAQAMPIVHDFRENNFTGNVPDPLLGTVLLRRRPVYGLFLSGNRFTGDIPGSLFDQCQNLQSFYIGLSQNFLSGTLPVEKLMDCNSLRYFEASSNNLSGNIPPEFGNLKRLAYLDLGMNNLSGIIPPQVGQLHELKYLILANNCLTGEIPAELGALSSLAVLDLSGNVLSGEIPKDLAELMYLEKLRLNSNNLSGDGPRTLAYLTSLDLDFKDISATLPKSRKLKSFSSRVPSVGNRYSDCCYEISRTPSSEPWPTSNSEDLSPHVMMYVQQNRRSSSLFVAAITSGCAIVGVLVILGLLFHYTKRQIPSWHGRRQGRRKVVTFGTINLQMNYDNIVRSTGNFSVDNLIGTGGFGATYKAEVMPGLLLAVKRLSLGRFQGIQQFEAEIRTLGRIQHPNLVTLIGYHASKSEMFLVYNYLPGGNLESLIHNSEKENISWNVRFKIALHIAQALAYLHNECTPKILHRDIKPSNILLDNKLNAYLSDFGLARLLAASETHATTDVAGTFGYVAPEYAMTCRVSDKADVYSYGVVLLELLSGKRALDPSFSNYGDGFNIVAWAYQHLHKGQAKEVFPPSLWLEAPHSELIDALKLAVTCTVDSLSVRPTMKQVVTRLQSLQPS